MRDNGPQSEVLITLVNGRLREVRVDAPALLLEDLTAKAVNLAKRLETAGRQKGETDARPA